MVEVSKLFGSLIYYDKNKIDEYKAIITGKRGVEVSEYQVTNDKGISVDFKVLGADAKANKSYTAKVKESLLYDCTEFEDMLTGRDDYCDFTISDDYDIETTPRGNIIKIDAYLSVPEQFDMMRILEQLKPMLKNSLTDTEKDVEMFMKQMVDEAKTTKIPVFVDLDDYLLCSKIQDENLMISYEDLAELESTEVTILARCSSSHMVKSSKAFYDPLKDFFELSRTLRKGFGTRCEELQEICADKDYKLIDILAIYQ